MVGRYRAIYREGKLLAEYEGDELTYLAPDYEPAKRSELPAPYFMKDIGEYRSPIDNTMVTTRSQHREHMRKHDVIEVGTQKMGHMQAAETPTVNRELGQAIKRRVEEVASMSQTEYDQSAAIQQAEHAEVAALITA